MMRDTTRSQSNASAAFTGSASIVSPVTTTKYAHQEEKLSELPSNRGNNGPGTAISAENTGRYSRVPLAKSDKNNASKDEEIEMLPANDYSHTHNPAREHPDTKTPQDRSAVQKSGEGSLQTAMQPSSNNPLFAPLPLYGPPSVMQDIRSYAFRSVSFVLSSTFVGIVLLGAVFSSIPPMCKNSWTRLTLGNPDQRRPLYKEEKAREKTREELNKVWKTQSKGNSRTWLEKDEERNLGYDEFIPTEGGPDRLLRDIGYYARRVGLDAEEFKVQTDDGFIISLHHVYNPLEFSPLTKAEHAAPVPNEILSTPASNASRSPKKPKFPILMLHGLLQSAGVYCVNDEESLAFYLCKEGYDVWLGDNRCGFQPEHAVFDYADPRMWAWNIRQMGTMDLPALTSRVLSETGFGKLGLIGHSQGTSQTFIALAKDQHPDLGEKLTVFCALAPTAYSGTRLDKPYFKFMRLISPGLFRMIFGIHAFIPIMMAMYPVVPDKIFGTLSYQVFSFLFNWSDDRWDRGLRDRMFQFSPVYLSVEHMRWWLGRDSFAEQMCILATKEEGEAEDKEDEIENCYASKNENSLCDEEEEKPKQDGEDTKEGEKKPKGSTAWFNHQVPPFALWVAGKDNLVDGHRLLRRFERGREPHVKVVHQSIIEEYEHLDVIWAIDVIEKVGREVKETLWKTCNVRDKVRVPKGCEHITHWIDDDE